MNRSLRKLFLGAQGALYAAFLALDLCGRTAESVPLKYAGILLCLAAALPASRTADGRLAVSALALTAAADWLLLVRDRDYAAGILLFCAVQGLYALRLARLRGRVCRPLLAARVAPFALFLCLPRARDALALTYFTNLACNALAAGCTVPRSPQQRQFAAGLVLFVCCDLCVGAYNLGLAGRAAAFGMWLFYLPSQVLLTLAAYARKSPAA